MPTVHPRIAERARQPRYTFAEAGRLLARQPTTLRRWAVGHDRLYRGKHVHDAALIRVDGALDGSQPPLSFLNLIELRFLASWRTTMPLPDIREALLYAGSKLGTDRPLLQLEFKRHGRELFVEYEGQLLSANRAGQSGWPAAARTFLDAVDYDEQENAAYRWWPLGRDRPVLLSTSVNAGRPTTAQTGVRTVSIATRLRDGWSHTEIHQDTAATEAEIVAAAEVEGLRAA